MQADQTHMDPIQPEAPACNAAPGEQHAHSLHGRHAELFVPNKATAIAAKVPVEQGAALHVYNAGLLLWPWVRSTVLQRGRSHGTCQILTCPNLPRSSSPTYICHFAAVKAALVPVSFPIHGHLGRLVAFDMELAAKHRPKVTRQEMHLRGHAPMCSLHITCNHFVDQLSWKGSCAKPCRCWTGVAYARHANARHPHAQGWTRASPC